MTPIKQNITSQLLIRTKILVVGVLLGLVFLTASSAVWATTLDLPTKTAVDIGITNISISDTNNAQLITDLYDKSNSTGLIYKTIHIAKYVLGGIFMVFLAIYAISLITANGNDESVTEFKNSMIYTLIGFIVLALADPVSQAFNFSDQSIGNFISDGAALNRSVEIGGYSLRAAAKLIQYLLGGMALLYMGMAGFRIITANGNDDTVTTARKTIIWATLGLVFATMVVPLVDNIFAPVADSSQSIIVDIDPTLSLDDQHALLLEAGRLASRAAILNQVKFFQTFVAVTATLMLFLVGFKMVTSGDNEEIITKQKKMLTWIFLGMSTILISEAFVAVFAPEVGGQIVAPGIDQIGTFSEQLGGFTNFLLTFTGSLAVLALIVGALYFSTAAVNAEQAEKGKKIILAAVLGLVLTISAYAIVNTILSGNAVIPDASISVGP